MGESVEPISGRLTHATRSWGGYADRARAFVAEYSITIVSMLVALVVWEIAVTALAVPAFVLPPPSSILRSLVRFWNILLFDTWITLIETLIGFAAGSLVALALATGIIFSRLFEKIIYPPAIVTQVVPKLAVAPLFIIWFGLDLLPKIMITIVVCLFPILINAVVGMRAVDPRILDLMYSVDASRWQVFSKVQFPNSAPYVFAGLKVGVTLAVVGAVVGEWLGSNAGLGHQILIANGQMRTDVLFAALIMLSVVGVGLFGAVTLLEAVMVPRQRQVNIFDKFS